MLSERYDIEARAVGEASWPELMQMLQRLLEDRFALKVHREMREDDIYVLTVARGGSKLRGSKDGGCVDRSPGKVLPPEKRRPNWGNNLQFPKGPYLEWTAVRIDMRGVVSALANFTGRSVVDKTALTGFFDIQLLLPPLEPPPGIEPVESPFTVLREQLGLVLEAARGPVEYLVIDSASRPTEN